jgi:hypothetical protein
MKRHLLPDTTKLLLTNKISWTLLIEEVGGLKKKQNCNSEKESNCYS